MPDSPNDHDDVVVEQFTRQAGFFVKLPGHDEATQLLLGMGRVRAEDVVLDVACGAGAVAFAAARIAGCVVGIDLTPAMIDHACAASRAAGLHNVDWHVGDARRLPFADASFDVVLTRYSLHHCPAPDKAVSEMVRVCRPGGRLVIADLLLEPEHATAYDAMERLRDPSHVRVLSPPELRRLLAAADLRNVEWAGYLFDLALEDLMKASFPKPGDADRVRSAIQVDVDVNALGVGSHRVGGQVRIAYPITVVSGTRATS